MALIFDIQINNLEKLLVFFSLQTFFFLSYAEFFSMICRGFSLRILTDVDIQDNIILENMKKSYAMGRGHSWLLKKRIDSIIDLKLIRNENNYYVLSNYGKVISKISILIKKILSLGKGGE